MPDWLSSDYLNAIFEYRDGQIYKKNSKKLVGFFDKDDGYFKIKIGNSKTNRSRVVWVMHGGAIPPEMQIDHIDRVKTNDSIHNLRLATRSEQNVNKARKKNALNTYRGVSKKGNKFKAHLDRNKVRFHLKCYNTEIEAAAAYNYAAKQLFKQFAVLNDVPDVIGEGEKKWITMKIQERLQQGI